MNPFGVSEKKARALAEQMARVGLREQDLDERFVRAQGPGGQSVHKVSTCVWLRHTLSRIAVKVQRERSQALNRYLARRWLAQKMETQQLGRLSATRKRIAAIRHQKRRRSRRAKARLLAEKRLHAAAKALRRPPNEND